MATPEPESEPSMEDILASIRKIISDDEDGSEDGQEADVPDASAKTDDAPAAESESNDQSSIDDIFDLTEVAEDEPAPEPEPDEELGQAAVDEIDFDSIGGEEEVAEDAADIDFVDAEADAETQSADPDAGDPDTDIEFSAGPEQTEPPSETPSLLSSGAQATASAAFGALASTMLSHSGGARTLEEIVEDLLRPLLKGWLDQNLPPLVEKLVREEIERVARRGQ